jgi:phospholipid/cholesterol/gamma-HCH transport system substrate-binding protein
MKAPRWWRRYDRTPVVELGRSNPARTGAVVLVIAVIVAYFGFTKHIPFKHGFRLKAVFSTAVNIRPTSPVRIAGVDVGKVSSVAREGNAGLVTMEIESGGLPVHSDATVKIRPRTFLEGNWFVDLQPGSPSARSLSSGATLPVTQTSDPVQLDQVLSALNTDTRANLQNFLIGLGDGFTRKPNAAENAEQDPALHGLNGAQALNRAYQEGPASLRGAAVINQAVSGTVPHDLSKLVAAIGKVTAALNVHEQQLGELIVNFNAFFRSFANQSAALRTTVAELPSSLAAINRGFASLGAALPPARTFALDILPGVKATPRSIAAQLPWIEQVKASLSPGELGGVAAGLEEAAPWIARLQSEQVPLYNEANLFNKCQTNLIFPAGNTKLQDGASSSGVEDYKEFWYSLVGLNSIGQGFDGNGTMAQFLLSSSGQTLRSAPVSILNTKVQGLRLLAHASLPPLGTRPAMPSQEPPYKPLVPCYTQALPNFNGPGSQGPADGSGG